MSRSTEALPRTALSFPTNALRGRPSRIVGGQGIQDNATLKNHEKNCAFGIQFIDPDLRENHT